MTARRRPSPTAWTLIALGCLALALLLGIPYLYAGDDLDLIRRRLRAWAGMTIFAGFGASMLAGLALRVDPGRMAAGFMALWFAAMVGRAWGWW